MANITTCLRSVALICLVFAATAYPTFWVTEKEAIAPPAANCLAHPVKGEGKHPAPKPDTGSTITVTDTETDLPVTAVCPGGGYTVSITFPEPRRALLTTTAGALDGAAEPAICPSRAYTAANADPEDTFEDTLKVPCDVTGTPIELKITSASGKTRNFNDLSTKLTITPLAQCPTSTCSAAAAANTTAAAAKGATTTTAATAAAAKNATAVTAEAVTPDPTRAVAAAGAGAAPAAEAPKAAGNSAGAVAGPASFAAVLLGMALAVFVF